MSVSYRILAWPTEIMRATEDYMMAMRNLEAADFVSNH